MTNFEKKMEAVRRPLELSEIEFRVQSVKAKGAILLAYKTARTDTKLLTEAGVKFQRNYQMLDGKLFCGVGIWDEDIEQWIWRFDTGTESNTEAQKGEASDAFKRAGFAWSIGVELYDFPFLWVNKRHGEDKFVDLKKWTWGLDRDKKGAIVNLSGKDEKGTVMFHWKATDANGKISEKKTKQASKDIDETQKIRTVIENLDLCKSSSQIMDMVEREGLDPLDPRISMHIEARVKLVG